MFRTKIFGIMATLILAGVLVILGLLFLDPLIAIPLAAVVMIVFIRMTLRVGNHRRDRMIEMQARAAQRGDASFFYDRPYGPLR